MHNIKKGMYAGHRRQGSPEGGARPSGIKDSISASSVAFSPDKSSKRASIAATFSLIFARLRRADSRFFSARIALSSSSVMSAVETAGVSPALLAAAVEPSAISLRRPAAAAAAAPADRAAAPTNRALAALGRPAGRPPTDGVGGDSRGGAGRLPLGGPGGGAT